MTRMAAEPPVSSCTIKRFRSLSKRSSFCLPAPVTSMGERESVAALRRVPHPSEPLCAPSPQPDTRNSGEGTLRPSPGLQLPQGPADRRTVRFGRRSGKCL